MTHPDITVEKIDVTDLFRLKHSSKSWYITIPRILVEQYGLNVGHYLKIHIKEARKPRKWEDQE